MNELLEAFNKKIENEGADRDYYRGLTDKVKSNELLTDEEKELINSVIYKISTDEESHNVMLKSVVEILKSKV